MEQIRAFGRIDPDATEMTGLWEVMCPKCNQKYFDAPAVSRTDGSAICTMCGHKEAVDVAVKAGALSEESADAILNRIKRVM